MLCRALLHIAAKMTHQFRHFEKLLAMIINTGAALLVAGGVISLLNFIEAALGFVVNNPTEYLAKDAKLSIAIAVALFATWKVNGRFITRGD